MFFLPAFADTTGSDMCETNAPYIILLLDILNEASYKISAIIVVAVL